MDGYVPCPYDGLASACYSSETSTADTPVAHTNGREYVSNRYAGTPTNLKSSSINFGPTAIYVDLWYNLRQPYN